MFAVTLLLFMLISLRMSMNWFGSVCPLWMDEFLVFTCDAMLARYVLSSCLSVHPSVCLSVRHKSEFYQNGYTCDYANNARGL